MGSGILDFIQKILLSIPGFLLVFTIKGFTQAYTANKLGDSTPKRMGRLTLNPMAHIDLMGFIAIVLFGFGWGKPFDFDTRNFKNVKRDNAIVILSGPASTFITGVIMSFFYVLIYKNAMDSIVLTQLSLIFLYATMICITLSLFYMLPLPGLDGYKLVTNFLPYKYYRYLYTVEKYSLYIFLIFILVFSKVLMVPILNISTQLFLLWSMIL